MAELEKSLEKLASVQEKLANENAAAAKKATEAAAKQLESDKEQQKSLQKIANSTIGGGTSTKDRLGAQRTLDELNSNMRITADKAEATAKWEQSSAGQAVALQRELEGQGKVAEDNKEFQKLSFKARKADFKQRLKDATSPAAKKEIREESRKDAAKNGSRLDKIGAGIGGLFEMGKKGLKTAALGGMAVLSTLALGGLMIALGKFLQSDTFKKMTKYIQDKIVPFLKDTFVSLKAFGVKVGEFYVKYLEPLIPIFKKYFIDTWENIKELFSGLGDAFSLFADGKWWEGIKTFFSAIGTYVFDQLDVVATAIFNIIASLFGLSKTDSVFGSISEFFTDLYDDIIFWITSTYDSIIKTISDTFTSVVNWFKSLFSGIVESIKTTLGAALAILTDFGSWIYNKAIKPIIDWFSTLFSDPIGALKILVKKTLTMLTDFGGFIYKKAVKPIIDWIGGLFGEENASKSIETYVGKFLDPILNFAEGIYNKYVKPIVDWVQKLFKSSTGKDEKMSMLSAAGDMIKDFVRNIFRSILPSPDTFKFKLPKLKVPFVGTFGGGSINLNPIPAGLYKFAGINPETGEKIPDPPKAVTVAAEKFGSDKVVQGMEAMASEAVKRDASSSAAGGGGPTNIVDARQSSSVTTTGQSGNSSITPNKFANLSRAEAAGY